MTFDQLKEKLKIQSQPHNPNACAYGCDGPIDPWDVDDIDEATWLAGYSQYHPAAKAAAEKVTEKVIVHTDKEKEEGDHFWQALILLAETRGALEMLLQLDTRKDFLSPSFHKDLTDLLSNVEDLVDQYNMESGTYSE